MKIAIVTVAYNRVDSLSRLLCSLERAYYNEKATLIISVDKSKTDVVERFADEYHWPHGDKIVDKHEKNLGLRPHMMSLGKWFDQFDAIAVLEDDIVVSPNFYIYTQQTVEKYHACEGIAGISLYDFYINYQTGCPFTPVKDEHDVYFMKGAVSWGEIWMKKQWLAFYDWYQNNLNFAPSNMIPERLFEWGEKSWLKYHTRYCIETNKYFVYPYVSLTTNFCDAGTNSKKPSSDYQVSMQRGKKRVYSLPKLDEAAIFYDGFFENESLYESLNLKEEECCLDINGTNKNRIGKKYWLTTNIVDYRIVKSFGLQLRPIELNVLERVEGDTIFLYEATIVEKNPNKSKGEVLRYYYHLGDNISHFVLKEYGLRKTLSDLFSKAISKITNI